MEFQLPVELHGTAAGVLAYSSLSALSGILLLWLVWVHRERTSFVALIGSFTLLSTVASIIGQVLFYIQWRDTVTAQFNEAVKRPGHPEVAHSNAATGAQLILFYIQYTCYNIEATLVLFWAFSLTQSVYGWLENPRLRKLAGRINIAGKVVSVVLPLILFALLQVPAVQQSYIGFFVTADFLLVLNLALGCMFLLAILAKYIQARRKFKTWSVNYGKNNRMSSSPGAQSSFSSKTPKPTGIYDRWLLARFTVGFCILGAFEVANIIGQLGGQANATKDILAGKPDFSLERGSRTILMFLPGVSPSLLSFVVFGTTRPFRCYMYNTFVPARFRRVDDEMENRRISVAIDARESKRESKTISSSRGHGPSISISKIDDRGIIMHPIRPHREWRPERLDSDDEGVVLVYPSPIQTPNRDGNWV